MSALPNDLERLRTLLRDGECCAAVLVHMGLEHRGEQNEQLLQVMSALCGGVQSGLVCGALTGAVCMMNVLDPENANAVMVPELAEWFADKVGGQYGGTDCNSIVHGDPLGRRTRCPGLVEETYFQAKEIMKTYGYEFD